MLAALICRANAYQSLKASNIKVRMIKMTKLKKWYIRNFNKPLYYDFLRIKAYASGGFVPFGLGSYGEGSIIDKNY